MGLAGLLLAEEELKARQAEAQEPEEGAPEATKAEEPEAAPEKPQAAATVAKKTAAKP
jgi:hypothetical protein